MEALFIAPTSTAGAARSRACVGPRFEAAGSSSTLSGPYSSCGSAVSSAQRDWKGAQSSKSFGRGGRLNDLKGLKQTRRRSPTRAQVLNLLSADQLDDAVGLLQSTDLSTAAGLEHATSAVAASTKEHVGASLEQTTAVVSASAAAAWAEVQPMISVGGAGSIDENSASRIAFELLNTACTAASSVTGSSASSAEVCVLVAATVPLTGHDNVSSDQFQQYCSDMAPDHDRQRLDRAINAIMVAGAAIYATAKIFTVDHDYWHGWTLYEIVRYAPVHNWCAYEQALQSNPVLAKMMISGIVYSLGDWIAQCCEGKPVFDFKRDRMIRSGLVGFCLHGSLSHHYYHVCEALFPFHDWWAVPLKVAFDQTIWSGFWNSVYFVVLGLLRLESPFTIASNLKSTFWPLLTAGWKLWPFAHLITYGFIPVEQRLLWVDMVELVWVAILSLYSNKAPEALASTNHDDDDTASSTQESRVM